MPKDIALVNLELFGKELGLDELIFDENNTCILGIDDEFSMHLTYEPTSDRLYLYSPLLDGLPPDVETKLNLYSELMQASLLGGKMAGCGVGVAKEEELILIHATIDMNDSQDPYALLKFAPLYVETVENWRRICADICSQPILTNANAKKVLNRLTENNVIANINDFIAIRNILTEAIDIGDYETALRACMQYLQIRSIKKDSLEYLEMKFNKAMLEFYLSDFDSANATLSSIRHSDIMKVFTNDTIDLHVKIEVLQAKICPQKQDDIAKCITSIETLLYIVGEIIDASKEPMPTRTAPLRLALANLQVLTTVFPKEIDLSQKKPKESKKFEQDYSSEFRAVMMYMYTVNEVEYALQTTKSLELENLSLEAYLRLYTFTQLLDLSQLPEQLQHDLEYKKAQFFKWSDIIFDRLITIAFKQRQWQDVLNIINIKQDLSFEDFLTKARCLVNLDKISEAIETYQNCLKFNERIDATFYCEYASCLYIAKEYATVTKITAMVIEKGFIFECNITQKKLLDKSLHGFFKNAKFSMDALVYTRYLDVLCDIKTTDIYDTDDEIEAYDKLQRIAVLKKVASEIDKKLSHKLLYQYHNSQRIAYEEALQQAKEQSKIFKQAQKRHAEQKINQLIGINRTAKLKFRFNIHEESYQTGILPDLLMGTLVSVIHDPIYYGLLFEEILQVTRNGVLPEYLFSFFERISTINDLSSNPAIQNQQLLITEMKDALKEDFKENNLFDSYLNECSERNQFGIYCLEIYYRVNNMNFMLWEERDANQLQLIKIFSGNPDTDCIHILSKPDTTFSMLKLVSKKDLSGSLVDSQDTLFRKPKKVGKITEDTAETVTHKLAPF